MPQPQFQPKTQCRLCNSRMLVPVLRLPSTPAANAFQTTPEAARALPRFPLEVRHCQGCLHSQLGHVVDPAYLFGDYAYTTGSSPALAAHFQRLGRELVTHWPKDKPSPLLLEVGSNDGTLLRAAREAGARVVGVEPATNLAELARAKGVPTFNAFFDAGIAEQVREQHGPVDVWVATNVLAHVDRLQELLRALWLCSGPATVGVIEVQYVGTLLQQGLFDMIYHEHLDYHAARPLSSALATNGWSVDRIEEVPTHGSSLRFRVRRVPAGLDVRSASWPPLLWLAEKNRDWVAEWAGLALKIEEESRHLREQLAPHKRVMVYGAPAKLTTLMYGLGLDTDEHFVGVVDDASSKQWRFTPGMGLPVLPMIALRDEKYSPDAILCSSWNYSEGIRGKLQTAGLGHIPFIVPFAEKGVRE